MADQWESLDIVSSPDTDPYYYDPLQGDFVDLEWEALHDPTN